MTRVVFPPWWSPAANPTSLSPNHAEMTQLHTGQALKVDASFRNRSRLHRLRRSCQKPLPDYCHFRKRSRAVKNAIMVSCHKRCCGYKTALKRRLFRSLFSASSTNRDYGYIKITSTIPLINCSGTCIVPI